MAAVYAHARRKINTREKTNKHLGKKQTDTRGKATRHSGENKQTFRKSKQALWEKQTDADTIVCFTKVACNYVVLGKCEILLMEVAK